MTPHSNQDATRSLSLNDSDSRSPHSSQQAALEVLPASRQAEQPAPQDLSPAVLELMIRYELGHFEPRIRARLAEIFRDDPPDAVQRLEKAAEYIGVDGQELNTWDTEARKQASLLAEQQASRIEP